MTTKKTRTLAARRDPVNLRLAALCFIVLAAIASALPVQAAIKCWTTEDGTRECGNKVPAKYAQQGYEERSSQGIKVGEQEKAKSPEELAAEIEAQRKKEEAARIAEIAAKEQENADSILLSTFTSVSDLEQTRDDKLSSVDAQIRLSEGQLVRLQKTYGELEQQAQAAERSGPGPSADLLKEMDDLRVQITDKESYLAEKEAEKVDIFAGFANDIERFKELKGL